jgi:hypothetical protein
VGYVTAALGDARAVLVADETGFLKKGTRSAGVQRQPRDHDTAGDGEDMIRLTAAEIRHLLAILAQPRHPDGHYLRWSRWRRRHQDRARKSHYQRRQHLRLLPHY